MAAYKTGAFVRSKYYTLFQEKWIPRSKSGAPKSRPRWASHTRIGIVWEYSPRGGGGFQSRLNQKKCVGTSSPKRVNRKGMAFFLS